ncbi:GNAT family N-acetyltransferase [Clostridium faecium]|uniref:GNAT family N-acetyltransferase n=1 Tax=Clostridium faecium TaxID=2762223 RepID=A0ABR8YUK0_9CLOT|nr:GNAT family N-acetyltransferase [Clostridium faecium]MBD8047817.1 GNAT family N-acetyltransferase [Clostridium faecium]
MNFKFSPMNSEYANEIAYNWKYDGIFSFYDMTADEEDLEEFLTEDKWGKNQFAVLNEKNQLVGFYSYYFQHDIIWVGFGLKPELTSKGLGADFVNSGINFVVEKSDYKKDYVMLAVASFNDRAIKLYEKIGFKYVEKYIQYTNGGNFEFIRMKKYII